MPRSSSISYQILPYGPNAWLLQLDNPDDIAALHTLRKASFQHIQECVVAYDSLLLTTSSPLTQSQVKALVHDTLQKHTSPDNKQRHHVIEVHYTGPDLQDLATASKLSIQEIITLHSSAIYSVRFLGFSAGFAYLDGLPEPLQLPRRSTPRPKMEPGAVAIGGKHAGIYSTPSPGGWNWLGNTDYPLFHPDRNDHSAFTLHPGDTLEFRPIS